MSHLLDNPLYNALISENKPLSSGDENVRVLHSDVGPFVGMREPTRPNFDLLATLIDDSRVVAVVTAEEIEIPDNWKVLRHLVLYQMLCTDPHALVSSNHQLIRLNDSHVPLMIRLTALTNPGPFAERTIKFGDYFGIFDGEKLIAMAGIRASVGAYREVSAVCTHPEHLGKGYAALLISHVANLIFKRGCMPYLHVRTDNINAIGLYHRLGFVTRHIMIFNITQRVI